MRSQRWRTATSCAAYNYKTASGRTNIALADQNGTNAAVWQYTAFGKAYNVSGTAAADYRYLFTGREWLAPVGLSEHRNRYYNPNTGRFLSRDSKYFVDGSNLYAYGHNNPANLSDPFGTSCSDMLLNNILANGAPVDSYSLNPDGKVTYTGDGFTLTDNGDGTVTLKGNPFGEDFAQTSSSSSGPGSPTLLTKGMNDSLDTMMMDDKFIQQLGLMYALNKAFGSNITRNADGSFHSMTATEFFSSIGDDSAMTDLYAGPTSPPLYLSSNGKIAGVTPVYSEDVWAVIHTHVFPGEPTYPADFANMSDGLSSLGIWSIVVTPDKIYFTGPEGEYYYLPTSAFIDAGEANGTTVTIPSEPPSKGPY